MKCSICSTESSKMMHCSILGSVCIKCCFSVSSGSPNLLKKIKEEKKLSKNEILKFCSECKQIVK